MQKASAATQQVCQVGVGVITEVRRLKTEHLTVLDDPDGNPGSVQLSSVHIEHGLRHGSPLTASATYVDARIKDRTYELLVSSVNAVLTLATLYKTTGAQCQRIAQPVLSPKCAIRHCSRASRLPSRRVRLCVRRLTDFTTPARWV
jgi:hypothetical protein